MAIIWSIAAHVTLDGFSILNHAFLVDHTPYCSMLRLIRICHILPAFVGRLLVAHQRFL